LIVAFVVAVWAAYFVPLALRRYDEASTARSLASLTSLSRVIPRRVRAVEAEAPVVEEPAEPLAPGRTVTRRAAVVAARRRRRTLLTLLFVTVVVAVLAVLAVAPRWSVAVPLAVVAAWLVACRVQVRGELGLRRPRAEKPAKQKVERRPIRVKRVSADEEQTVVVSGLLDDIDPGRQHVMETAELEADALEEKIVIAVPVSSTTGETLWDPLPVTLPTYVTKPRAGRTVRTIDFAQPGAWTSGHVEGENIDFPQRQDERSDNDGHPDQRRAVGH